MENPTFLYFETSAIERKNVEEVFKNVAENHLAIQAELAADGRRDSETDGGSESKKKFDINEQKAARGDKKACGC